MFAGSKSWLITEILAMMLKTQLVARQGAFSDDASTLRKPITIAWTSQIFPTPEKGFCGSPELGRSAWLT
jgi:hypothetical protein